MCSHRENYIIEVTIQTSPHWLVQDGNAYEDLISISSTFEQPSFTHVANVVTCEVTCDKLL